MGVLDKLENAAEDLLLKTVGEGISKAIGALSDLAFGDSADDDLKEKLARAALKGAADVVAEEALQREARAHLQERAERTLRAIETIDVRALFTPTGDVTDLDVPITIAATLTPISWDLVKRSGEPIITPEDGSDLLGTVLGVPVSAGDVDRNVPPRLQDLIDRAASAPGSSDESDPSSKR